MKTAIKPNLSINTKQDVTGGRKETGKGAPVKETPTFAPTPSVGGKKDVTENQLTKKDLDLKSTNEFKVTKIGK